MTDATETGARLDTWQAMEPYEPGDGWMRARVQNVSSEGNFSEAEICSHHHGTTGEAHRCAVRMAQAMNTSQELELISYAATPAEIEQDAWNYPHDEPCPRCGRRQWGLGPDTVDSDNPSDAEQETCGACGYKFS